MSLSALEHSPAEPTSRQLSTALGESERAWSALCRWATESAGVDAWEWRSSGVKYGWALRGKRGERTILYLIPQRDAFLVGLVLGDRAMVAVRDAPLSSATMAVISSAPRYGEGTGFRLPVATPAELEDVKVLVGIKLAH
ncbi:MAG TPA: DUF3788 family protein [Gemmatimonadaceae bacterium]|nr:DUF3788 family protein [Gemmatimonadaceae bacterium]